MTKDFSNSKNEGIEFKGINDELNTLLSDTQTELNILKLKNQELEDQLKHYSVEVSYTIFRKELYL